MKHITKAHPHLRKPIIEGLLSAIMSGSGEAYLSAYAIFLGATALEAGLVTALPPLIGSLVLLAFLNRIAKTQSRVETLANLSACQALLWTPMALLAFIPESSSTIILLLIVLTTIHYGISAVLSPIWNSLMGDIVPAEIRGTYFGQRNKIVLLSSLVATTGAGVLLQYFKDQHITKWGYLFIFITAGVARFASSWMLKRYPESGTAEGLDDPFTFTEFLRRSHRSNFLKFTTFVGIYNFTVFISAPFVAYYLLEGLQYTYVEFTLVVSFSIFAQLMTMQRWGRLADEFGTKKILIVSCIGYSLCEFLWLLSSNFWYVLLIRAISGMLWAGFCLSSSAFIFDSVTPPKRLRCVSYQNLINNFCIISGTLFGGAIIQCIPFTVGFPADLTESGSPILILFLISGTMRLVTLTSLISFAEVRNVPQVRSTDIVFRLLHLRAFSGNQIVVISSHDTGNSNIIGLKNVQPEENNG